MLSFIYFIIGVLLWFAIVALANSTDNDQRLVQPKTHFRPTTNYNGAGGGMRSYRIPGTGAL
jgi:hypothetical protein